MVLSRLLGARRERIVSLFVARVERDALSPQGLSATLLADHIPHFLDEIVAELNAEKQPHSKSDAVDTSKTARQHGEQRWALGYDLEALIREYGVLRHCIFEVAREESAALTLDEHEVLSKCLSVGVAEAATAYAAHRDAQLALQKANLEFLTDAGELLSSSLDHRPTLDRLTRLLVPRLADWCAIHLDGAEGGEIPLAHVDEAKLPVLRELLARFPPSQDLLQRQLRDVGGTTTPELVADVEPGSLETIAQDPEHLALLRRIDTRSWIVLPLQVEDHLFGRLVLAYSDSDRRYDADTVRLAMEVARRAAVAIDNARLFELSQSERSRAEATARSKDEFVAMLSHELRTPLNSILGWLRMMRDGGASPARHEHALDVIERNARAQERLVSDLIDISNVITGRIRITASQVDLADVVERAVEGVRAAAEAKRIRLRTSTVPGESIIRGDGDRLQQVVWNIVANAVKFTPKDGTVDVRLERIESDLQLIVTDDGVGIEPDFLPHVFETFQQANRSFSRRFGGLGLGLSIAKHLVELHGGSLTARSDGPGLGSSFTVRLPISPLVSTTLGIRKISDANAAAEPPGPAAGGHGVAVLVADDDADARDLVTFVLETHGMQVHAVASVAAAVKELTTFAPAVIVSDIGMPVENGYTLIRHLRSVGAAGDKGIPAIALTAFGRLDERNRALVEGFDLHLTKPVEPLVLVRSILDLARGRPA